jgi:hypothetical protein
MKITLSSNSFKKISELISATAKDQKAKKNKQGNGVHDGKVENMKDRKSIFPIIKHF